jgi:hypothetical protein
MIEDANAEGKGSSASATNPNQRSFVESDSFREGTVFDHRERLDEMDMFDRKHLGDDPNRW